MHGATRSGGRATERFREVAFRAVPLAVMASAALAGALGGSGWSAAVGPLPWIIALGFVGLPHGAADFAVSHRTWQGWRLAMVWLAYTAVMAAVVASFAVAPVTTIVAFTVFSCWHFGTAHRDTDSRTSMASRSVAALSRGCLVLAVPLAAWPTETAAVATDLAAFSVGHGTAAEFFPPAAVGSAGVGLAAMSVVALAVEGLAATRWPRSRRAWHKLLGELVVIASLGWFTDPLFSVGLSFLVWHGWRQMEPLAVSLTGEKPRSWAGLGRAVVRIHLDALPLLVPAWAAIGLGWWLRSTDHAPRDLAIISIAAYLIVTPAHELLGDLLRQMACQQHPPRVVQSAVRLSDGRVPTRGRRIQASH
jgi:Brp/Blh family beta-carotene 15,15'-monooxygenase